MARILVVRGVDARGKDVRIDRTYLSESLRLRAQELATNELGPRSEIDVGRQLDREAAQHQLTAIDRRLAPLVAPNGTLAVADIAAAANGAKLSRPHAIARLDVLEQLHLVERVSRTSWRFEKGWQETLQRLGERGDIIKRTHRALRRPPAAYQIFDPASGRPIEGVVRHKGLHDEHTGTAFVIVETARREAHYVRLDAAGAEPLVTGERVRVAAVSTNWLTAPDQAIHRVPQEHLQRRCSPATARGAPGRHRGAPLVTRVRTDAPAPPDRDPPLDRAVDPERSRGPTPLPPDESPRHARGPQPRVRPPASSVSACAKCACSSIRGSSRVRALARAR
jgi:hypothetical protein